MNQSTRLNYMPIRLTLCQRFTDWIGTTQHRIINEIRISGEFDLVWYRTTYPDVSHSGLDPIDHYLRSDIKDGRNPSIYFDSAWYLEQNPDVEKSGINPLLHYVRHGRLEGREPGPAGKPGDPLELRKENDLLVSELHKVQENLAGAFEGLHGAQEERDQLRAELATLVGERDTLRIRQQELEGVLVAEKKAGDEQARLADERADHIEEMQVGLAEYQVQVDTLLAHEETLKNETARLQAARDQQLADLNQLQSECNQLQQEISSLGQVLTDRDNTVREIQGQREKLAASLQELTNKYDDQTKQINHLQRQLQVMEQDRVSLESEKEAIEQQLAGSVAELSGFQGLMETEREKAEEQFKLIASLLAEEGVA